jgi:transcriptional regulator with XRE-family HTH domain
MKNKLTPNGPAIRTIRQLKGWDLRRFAAHVEISESHLGNVENERRGLPPDKILRIAKALDVPVGAITITRTTSEPVHPLAKVA